MKRRSKNENLRTVLDRVGVSQRQSSEGGRRAHKQMQTQRESEREGPRLPVFGETRRGYLYDSESKGEQYMLH